MLFVTFGAAQAQIVNDSVRIFPDSIVSVENEEPMMMTNMHIQADTTSVLVDTLVAVKNDTAVFKPNPMRAVWMGALIPGFGQIVNRKYWKLPIVYGGFLGFAYAINWNNSRYVAYKNGYRDIIDGDPTTNFHVEMLPRGYTLENYPGGISTYQNRLKSGMDQFRRYRDMSILLSIGYYALVMLDAFVDAQLYDFDINEDLVLNVAPARIEYNQHNPKSAYGLQWSVRF